MVCVQVVLAWASGAPFVDVCKLTDEPEGSIVRTIMRLNELIKGVHVL
jgi:antiviral helicase SKI2